MVERHESMYSLYRWFLGTVLMLLALGCRGGPDAESAGDVARAPLADLPADSALAELERWLLEYSPLQIQFIVVSEGTVESNLRGALALLEDGGLNLSADGDFGGQPHMLRLVADGQRIRVGESADSVVAQPPGLREAVVIGFTRMGILHNLARLTSGLTPDHMEGGVREWVQVDSVSWGPRETVEGVETLTLDFRLTVDGTRSGSSRLYLDAESEQPIRRMLTVETPEGEMQVTESYEIF